MDRARWRRRPRAATLIAVAIFAVPVVLSALAAAVVARALPMPTTGVARAGWWALVLGASLATFAGGALGGRRLLPLAALLRLSMLFPERAPSRFKVALRAGSTRRLERRVRVAAELTERETPPPEAAEVILTLAASLSAHDRATRGHSERVRAYAELIAEEMDLPPEEVDRLRWSALLHDVGKVVVPAHVLNQPNGLSHEQWELIRRHPVEGDKLAAPLRPWLGEWADAIVQHHERYDGAGYPAGIAAAEISLGARIVSVADSFEVMTAIRSYKQALDPAASREELATHAGSQFDPAVVRAFLNVGIGRLRLAMGPIAWLAALPFVGGVTRLRTEVTTVGQAVAAGGVAALVAVGVAGGPAPEAARPQAEVAAGAPATADDAAPVGRGTSPPPTGPALAAEPAPAAGPAAVVTVPPVTPRRLPTAVAPPTPTTAAGGAPPAATPPPPAAEGPPPAPVDDDAKVMRGTTTAVDVLANDGGRFDRTTLRIIEAPTRGTATVDASQRIVYRAVTNGSDEVDYRVCDAAGRCGTAVLRIAVSSAAG